jgi:hypothetical protein
MRVMMGGIAGSKPMSYSCGLGAQINFVDLSLYLTFAAESLINLFFHFLQATISKQSFLETLGKENAQFSPLYPEIAKNHLEQEHIYI